MTGLIALFAGHRNACNLLLALMVVSGIYGLLKLNSQFLPEFGIDRVTVAVEWPGATADDVYSNISQAIEPEVRFLDNVKRVKALAYEGLARVNIEFEPGNDMQAALSSVEAAISRIRTLPEDSKTPEISRVVRHETLMQVILSGPYPDTSLRKFAKQLRDGLLDRGVDKVTLVGTPDEEIHVEVPSAALRRLDLTLSSIAARIGNASQDLPSGDLGDGQRQVRSLGLLTTARALGEVEIKAYEDGRKVYLRDIAQVREAHDEQGVTVYRNTRQAVELRIQRAVSSDALLQARAVESYLDEVEPTLPANLVMERYDATTNLLKDRINLLIKNGTGGLVLVTLILITFLKVRVAFWVMAGIPASLMATFGVMLATGQTLNMVSLFGLIMAIGIIVDDAVVVGEHVDTRSRFAPPLQASIEGARRMAVPVIASALTTISAFLPLFVISDVIGQIIAAIPMVVIAVLIASLIECFLVLPGHLRGALAHSRPSARSLGARYRSWFDGHFATFRDGPFRSFVRACVDWRYATLAVAAGLFLLVLGMVAGGRVGFTFFPSPEPDKIFANIQMVPGTSRAKTREMLAELDRALHAAARKLESSPGSLVQTSVGKIGTFVGQDPAAAANDAPADNIGGLIAELLTADRRKVRVQALIGAWNAEIRPVAGLDNLTIREERGGPPGKDVDVRLIGNDVHSLKKAANELKLLLARYPGVSAIEDNLPYGRLETILEVSQQGKALGFTTDNVGQQVRNSIEGAIAKRFPRGEEEVTVRVKLPDHELDTDLLERLYLRSPAGMEVPLAEVVTRRSNQSFSRISSENGRRQVAVTASLNTALMNTEEILGAIQRDGLQDILDRYSLDVSYKGKSEERVETFEDMKIGVLIGLASIYIILAWTFASYVRPVVVMAIIPMGLVGAVLGHLLLGYNFSMLSLTALIGLSGIVVNNSIILVNTMERRAESEPLADAIVNGTCDRLRPVILTSATTIGGLTPLLFEKSLQAQFLIPMAVTIVFGLGCAAVLVLSVIPALMAVQEDLRKLLGHPAEMTASGSGT